MGQMYVMDIGSLVGWEEKTRTESQTERGVQAIEQEQYPFFSCLSHVEQRWLENHWVEIFANMPGYKLFKETGDMSHVQEEPNLVIWQELGYIPWWFRTTTGQVKQARLFYRLNQELGLSMGHFPTEQAIRQKVIFLENKKEREQIVRRFMVENGVVAS